MRKLLLSSIGILISSTIAFAQPANDDCATSQVITPDSSCVSGATTDGFTDAADNLTDLWGCQGGAGGPGATHPDVWYEFVATGSSFITTATEGLGWAGDMEVILAEPGPLGCLDLFTIIASSCGASPQQITFNGLIPGNTYYIIVANPSNGTTGAFDLCTETWIPPMSCTDNDDCNSPDVLTLNPSGSPGAQLCISDCNTGATPGPDFAGANCYDFPNATVWYEFTTDAGAATLDIDLNSLDMSDPEFTLFTTADCNNFTIIECVEGTGGNANSNGISVAFSTTYICLLYTSPSPRDGLLSRMPSSA